MGYWIAMACILAVLVAGNISVVYADSSTSAEIMFDLDQSVSGTGFYNTYQNISMGQTVLNNIYHGSGSYVYDARTEARASNFGDEGSSKSQQTIRMRETIDAVYSGTKFGIGGSSGPLNFKSPIGALNCITNYGEGAEMNYEFMYADILKKDTDASLYWNSNLSDVEWEDYRRKAQGITNLSLESEFSGKAHIGALSTEPGKKHPIAMTLIDEDYSGQFAITKKMSLDSYFNETAIYQDWLPCCAGGWNFMDLQDQRGHGASAKGIFDCTCYNVPSMAGPRS